MNGLAPGAMNAMVNGTNGAPRGLENREELKTKLNTFIYDYFLRNDQFDLARALKASQLSIHTSKTAPARKPNGEDNGEDSKDDLDSKKPSDLPYPSEVPSGATDNSFLLDWFQIFWEMFFAPRKDSARINPSPAAAAYMSQQQQNMVRQNGMPNGIVPGYPNMMRTGGPAAMNMAGRGIQQNPNMRQLNPAVAAQQQQQLMLQQQQQQRQQMLQNNQQMAREGSDIDMIDPSLLGQAQFNNFQGQNTKKNLDTYSQSLANQTLRQQGMPPNMSGQMMGNQGSMEEFYQGSGNGMRAQIPPNGQPQGGQGNHALQDYQMQLMLLEQQNKKRLLMARQEQDQVRPGDQPMGGQAGFAPNMSPQGSRSGPSPNPSEQMKQRGTPKLGQAGLPGGPNSPMPDANMVHARGSPGAMGFNGMDMMPQGMKGVDGMPIGPGMRPPSSHPGFNGGPANAAQMEAMRVAQQNGRMPNGAGGWQQMGQGQTPGMPQGPQPGQQMGTPQQRNVNMPPPQNVPAPTGANGRPVSPAQSAAAGTPQPANKAAPAKKGKAGKDNKKAPQKKNTTAATPSAEDNPPQTPTPATPITPMHPNSFKDGKAANGSQPITGQLNPNIGAPTHVPQSQQDASMIGGHFGELDGLDPNGNLNLNFPTIDGNDVLELDFDVFLQTGDTDMGTEFMNYGNFDNLEAVAGDP